MPGQSRDHFNWTARAESKLHFMFEAGSNYQEIADALGTSKNSVMHKAKRLGLQKTKNTVQPVIVRKPDRIRRRTLNTLQLLDIPSDRYDT